MLENLKLYGKEEDAGRCPKKRERAEHSALGETGTGQVRTAKGKRVPFLGFLTTFGVWLSGPGQSWTRPNGLPRFPGPKAGMDHHPRVHTPPPASSRRDHSELGRRHASSTPGRCQWKRWGCTSHGLGSRLRGCARHKHRDLPPRSSKGGSRCSPARADPAFRRGGTRSLLQVAARPGRSRPRTPPGSPARNAAAGASVSGQGLSFSSWELTARRRSTPGSECPPLGSVTRGAENPFSGSAFQPQYQAPEAALHSRALQTPLPEAPQTGLMWELRRAPSFLAFQLPNSSPGWSQALGDTSRPHSLGCIHRALRRAPVLCSLSFPIYKVGGLRPGRHTVGTRSFKPKFSETDALGTLGEPPALSGLSFSSLGRGRAPLHTHSAPPLPQS